MIEVEPSPEDQAQSEPATDMESLLEEHADYSLPRPGDIRVGRVIQIGPDGVLVSIGFKREGLVSREDLQQMRRAKMDEIQVDDEVPVLVLRSQDAEGYLAVSIFKARLAEDWISAEKLMESGEIVETEITGYNRGGLTVQFGRIRGFIPLSHVVGMPRRLGDAERRERLKERIGQKVGLRVIEVDRRRRRLILSQRQANRAWQRVRRKRLLEELQEGERRAGTVTSITDFGVFVDLGGADGLVHLSELSWGRVDNAGDVVDIGDQIEVVVLGVDRERERIALSLKQTQEDPWETVDRRYEDGDLIEGRVTQVSSIGAFVELEPGVEGLLHVSELVGAPAVVPEEVLQGGDAVLVKIIRIEKGRRRIGLSARRVRRDEWEQWVAEKAAEAEQEAEEEPAEVEEAVEVEAGEPAEVEEAVEAEAGEPAEAEDAVEVEAGEPAEVEGTVEAEAGEPAEVEEAVEAEAGEPAEVEETVEAEAGEPAEVEETVEAEAGEPAEAEEAVEVEAEELADEVAESVAEDLSELETAGRTGE
jgi:small subunit ribosomal protein S1